eukprot:834442-Rhodomonas_salina.2
MMIATAYDDGHDASAAVSMSLLLGTRHTRNPLGCQLAEQAEARMVSCRLEFAFGRSHLPRALGFVNTILYSKASPSTYSHHQPNLASREHRMRRSRTPSCLQNLAEGRRSREGERHGARGHAVRPQPLPLRLRLRPARQSESESNLSQTIPPTVEREESRVRPGAARRLGLGISDLRLVRH